VRYNGASDVLKGVNLAFEAAQKVGIVGQTGCGKSTLLLALLRIVEPHSGRVIINGVDTGSIGLKTLRQSLGLVPQDPVTFSGTVRHNLDPCGSYTEAQLWWALGCVQMSEYVEGLPNRLEQMLSGDGGDLSFGQRQLLCLARMVLRQPGLLLLDEATSAVEPHTQELMQGALISAFSHCTVVVIAHRLEIISDFDQVVVMQGGSVMESGPMQELRCKTGGAFHAMLTAGRTW